ncbi:hypothetical protein RSAG8_13733, partial [Rhizoctonia solani AG-8 WAC10335]
MLGDSDSHVSDDVSAAEKSNTRTRQKEEERARRKVKGKAWKEKAQKKAELEVEEQEKEVMVVELRVEGRGKGKAQMTLEVDSDSSLRSGLGSGSGSGSGSGLESGSEGDSGSEADQASEEDLDGEESPPRNIVPDTKLPEFESKKQLEVFIAQLRDSFNSPVQSKHQGLATSTSQPVRSCSMINRALKIAKRIKSKVEETVGIDSGGGDEMQKQKRIKALALRALLLLCGMKWSNDAEKLVLLYDRNNKPAWYNNCNQLIPHFKLDFSTNWAGWGKEFLETVQEIMEDWEKVLLVDEPMGSYRNVLITGMHYGPRGHRLHAVYLRISKTLQIRCGRCCTNLRSFRRWSGELGGLDWLRIYLRNFRS